MSLEPKPADIPRIPGALRLYKISSVITGVFLLLLCAEMLVKYAFGHELELGGPNGFLAFSPTGTLTGVNLSTGILIVHGWFYVLYLFSDFQLWSMMRWPFTRFLLIALGGIIPTLSFFLEVRVAREVEAFLADREASAATLEARP
ncbi:DUF3817 domain-containing protein [Cryobacterium sp. Sr8]|uniref:Integral membrane protein n=1 Tax=Cryobacterium psychrotolerans TaxID=386301 RepID=A0A1G9AI20_9MICO|nr:MULTISPECIES: DUF3817 domain-containing protein [Cryobacterium]TFD43834.1 DUF3817 domain-containing protein [Cryobacterium sp. TMT1-2-1]TFD76580.1 DUF3817 domain-containing protein [Cryobacterium sp. Sr8]TFD89647.1 DUF3817 domain-containing protein [Cryobacterium psychrotolerans]SDK27016.1 integral membrane protein [Cryobacterium psychrotolerans]